MEPPQIETDREYEIRVPAIDADGNEVSGIRTPDVSVPRATYTGWNIRSDLVGPNAMYSIVGSYLPFAANKAERAAVGDERLSLEERYPSNVEYVRRVYEAADLLWRKGFLLEEDAARYVEVAKQKG